MDALRTICDQRKVYKLTFDDIENMSLLELKKAAAFPDRLLARLKQCSLSDVPKTPRTLTRLLPHAVMHDDFDGALGDKNCMLAPGGRFLVTCTPTMLHLWDLGRGPQSTVAFCCSTPVFDIPGDVNEPFGSCKSQIADLRTTSDSLGLRVIVQVEFQGV